jgi:hypothetical protein
MVVCEKHDGISLTLHLTNKKQTKIKQTVKQLQFKTHRCRGLINSLILKWAIKEEKIDHPNGADDILLLLIFSTVYLFNNVELIILALFVAQDDKDEKNHLFLWQI